MHFLADSTGTKRQASFLSNSRCHGGAYGSSCCGCQLLNFCVEPPDYPLHSFTALIDEKQRVRSLEGLNKQLWLQAQNSPKEGRHKSEWFSTLFSFTTILRKKQWKCIRVTSNLSPFMLRVFSMFSICYFCTVANKSLRISLVCNNTNVKSVDYFLEFDFSFGCVFFFAKRSQKATLSH